MVLFLIKKLKYLWSFKGRFGFFHTHMTFHLNELTATNKIMNTYGLHLGTCWSILITVEAIYVSYCLQDMRIQKIHVMYISEDLVSLRVGDKTCYEYIQVYTHYKMFILICMFSIKWSWVLNNGRLFLHNKIYSYYLWIQYKYYYN